MMSANYKTKKLLRESVGKIFKYTETSMFGSEFKPNGSFFVVGPSPTERKWYAEVFMKDGLINKVF